MLYFELQIPQAASSKAITDLQKMMSEIDDISCNNECCHIKGNVRLIPSKTYSSEVSCYTKDLGVFMVKPCGYQITKDGYSDNIRMNEKDKLLSMFQKSMSSKYWSGQEISIRQYSWDIYLSPFLSDVWHIIATMNGRR